MKMVMIAAISMDGYIANNDHPHPGTWTSDEDKEHLRKHVRSHKLLVVGKGTYEVYGKIHSSNILRVVLTRNPEEYSDDAVPDELVFMNVTPKEFVSTYQDRFYSCLVLGGAYVYESFLNAGMIDEIYLTVEPISFGEGTPLISSGKKLEDIVNLPKPETTKLNDRGSILKHYVLKK